MGIDKEEENVKSNWEWSGRFMAVTDGSLGCSVVKDRKGCS